MDIINKTDQEYITLAIHSVLHQHKNRVHLLLDTEKSFSFIRMMSSEIMKAAQTYKNISMSCEKQENL